MKKVKGKATPKGAKPQRQNSLRWLYASLLGVLILLVGILLWSNDSGNDHAEHVSRSPNQSKAMTQPVMRQAESTSRVDEKLKATPPEKEVIPPIQTANKDPYQAVQYHPLKQHGIALVIDDVGYDLPALRRILALNLPVAIAIIPDSPHAKEAAEMAHRSGHMVMLHMPMEPANPHYRARMDSSFLRSDMSEAMVKSMLRKGLEKVPYVQGINNHMGSFLTSMFEPMTWVMAFCKKNQLFFIDSKTTAKSIASDVAQNYGLVWGERRVFLDHSIKEVDIKQAWKQAERYAKQKGSCIVIAHPHPETLAFLEKNLTHLQPSIRNLTGLLHVPKRD